MNTIINISADTSDHAREAAVNQAYAQGFKYVQALFVKETAPRQYEVTLLVSK